MSMAIPGLVLVDLDGTLVDTIPDIAFSVDTMLTELGLPAAGEGRVRNWVGNGTDALVRRALEAADGDPGDETTLEQALSIFGELYADHICDRSRIYPGVDAGLAFLHGTGAQLACVTNKSSAFTDELLAKLGLDEHFSLVVSGDSLPRRKPDPMPLLHAAEHFAVAPEDAVLIGDSANDVKAARAAGFRIVCVTYGYNHGDDIRASRPDALVDSLQELPDVFERPGRMHTADSASCS